jgi:hypothetical protein
MTIVHGSATRAAGTVSTVDLSATAGIVGDIP